MQDGLRCSRATSLSIASNCRRLIDECEEITGLYELAAALLRSVGVEMSHAPAAAARGRDSYRRHPPRASVSSRRVAS